VVIAIILARMNSTRLPNKVLIDIKDKPVIRHVYDRVSSSKYIDKTIVATSISESDSQIEDYCSKNSILVFRGNEEDVLDRFYNTANNFNVNEEDAIVRITADCPLIDPDVIDIVVKNYLNNDEIQYASNIRPPTYPDGLDVEVFSFRLLKEMWGNAKLKSEREHVTQYVSNNMNNIIISNVENNIDLSHLRWTLDEKEDLLFIRHIYDALYNEDKLFTMADIEKLLKTNPYLLKINKKFNRNEGLIKSLKEDEKYE
jgi:spore coat polysaccharide biosynthesis protein SpsF (cytidylyltransferase family)